MPVRRLLDDVKDGLEQAFKARMLPTDDVVFDVSMETIQVHGSEDGEDEHACSVESMVKIWVGLRCPEMSNTAMSTMSMLVEPTDLDDEDVAKLGERIWVGVSSQRALTNMQAGL